MGQTKFHKNLTFSDVMQTGRSCVFRLGVLWNAFFDVRSNCTWSGPVCTLLKPASDDFWFLHWVTNHLLTKMPCSNSFIQKLSGGEPITWQHTRESETLRGVTAHTSGLRGRLKSSHIADKRKNFHMALHPLPPSSNESVIDSGSNVWQMAVHMILVLPHNLPKQCRLSHAGMLPWRFSIHCEMNKKTISNSRTKIRFLLFFLFRTVKSRQLGVVLQCRTGVSACHCLQPGLQKPINICDESIAAACMHLPPFLFGLV